MAVIRRCPSGRWQGIVRRKGFPPQSKTFATQADAAQWARRTEAQIDARTFEDRDPLNERPLQKRSTAIWLK